MAKCFSTQTGVIKITQCIWQTWEIVLCLHSITIKHFERNIVSVRYFKRKNT